MARRARSNSTLRQYPATQRWGIAATRVVSDFGDGAWVGGTGSNDGHVRERVLTTEWGAGKLLTRVLIVALSLAEFWRWRSGGEASVCCASGWVGHALLIALLFVVLQGDLQLYWRRARFRERAFTSPHLQKHVGGCHCGAVVFEAMMARCLVAWDCNCSVRDCSARPPTRAPLKHMHTRARAHSYRATQSHHHTDTHARACPNPNSLIPRSASRFVT